MEIITLGRIYIQTVYLFPFWVFKIGDKVSKHETS